MKSSTLKSLLVAGAIATASFSQATQAAIYYFDYTYDGTSTFTTLSAAGSTFTVGDTIQATFRADGAGYWTATAGTNVWTPQGINEAGTRYGDLYWDFSNNGSTVDSGSALGLGSSAVHIPQQVITSSSILFDQLSWNYTLTSSDSPTNTLNGSTFGFGGALGMYWNGTVTYYAAAPVPEPETYAMLLAGLGLLGFHARRRKLKEVAAA